MSAPDTGPPEKDGAAPFREGRHQGTITGLSIWLLPDLWQGRKGKALAPDPPCCGTLIRTRAGGKLMRLALCPSAPRGEWQAAALAYFRGLRAAEVTAAQLREMFAPQAPVGFADPTPFLSFGRYRGQTVRWIAEHAPSYAEWLLRKAVNLSPALHGEFRRELRRRYGTAATPWPATP